MAGCQTAVSNIVMSMIVLLTLEFITPLFKYLPNAILAAIIIAAVVNLVDINAMIIIWKIDKFDFTACMGAFLGVVFISVEIGLLIAVAIVTSSPFNLSFLPFFLLHLEYVFFGALSTRFAFPLPRFYCKSQGLGWHYLEISLELQFTETFSSIQQLLQRLVS